MLSLQSWIQTDHMVPVYLRLSGSHRANRQGRLQETNKAVLILLTVRNVLIETRKKFIHMVLNQSHAPCTEFRRTLGEQLSCPLTNSYRDSVSYSPVQNHHRTILVHSLAHVLICLMPHPFTATLNNLPPFTIVLLWLFYLSVDWTFGEELLRTNYRSPIMS